MHTLIPIRSANLGNARMEEYNSNLSDNGDHSMKTGIEIVYEVNCQPLHDSFAIKNTVVYTNFHYESFTTLNDALSFCKEHATGEACYIGMRIEEQLLNDDEPHKVIATHNPYEILGIEEVQL